MKTVTNVIGIDPGKKGGVCVLNPVGDIYNMIPTPTLKLKNKNDYDVRAMAAIFHREIKRGYYPAVYLESVHSMPKQGVVSMFEFGKGFGLWIGIVTALGLPLALVRPQDWKKEIMVGTDKSKGAAIQLSKQLCPDINLKRTERSKKDDDNLAEAYLIATYGHLKVRS